MLFNQILRIILALNSYYIFSILHVCFLSTISEIKSEPNEKTIKLMIAFISDIKSDQ